MPILTVLSLILTIIKVVGALTDWLATPPEITAAVRAKVDTMQAQTAAIETTVDELREAHARVESA